MILEKEYEYTREHTASALEIADRTFLKKRRLISLVTSLVIIGAGALITLLDGNYRAAIFFGILAVIDALVVLFGRTDRKAFEAEVSPEGGQKYWAAQRRFTLHEDSVVMHAPYSNPDEYLTEVQKADPEFMKYREEMIEECSHVRIMLDKCRAYESPRAFLLRSRFMELTLLKSDFSPEEAELISSTLSKVMGKRFTAFAQV